MSASNGLNQVIERNYDKLMTRTENRPVATGRMGVLEASIVSLFLGICGVLILGLYFNQLTGILALSSLAIYAFIYTPLKEFILLMYLWELFQVLCHQYWATWPLQIH